MAGQYKPFADLLASDGYRVKASRVRFSPEALSGIDVLVVANANARNMTDPAFTEAECDAVRDWVRAGGALLLIADHAPYGTSAANLAARFGVTMGSGWVFEPTAGSATTQLVFSRENGRLGTHPVLRGREATEQVGTVRSFTGQSLTVPDGATALLSLGVEAREARNTDDLNAEAAACKAGAAETAGQRSTSVAGRAHALAMTVGKGRVVILGEAAMFSAQVVTLPADGKQVTFKAGMNAAGNDNRQFALNVVHWLSGILADR